MAYQATGMFNDAGKPLWYDPATGNYTDVDPNPSADSMWFKSMVGEGDPAYFQLDHNGMPGGVWSPSTTGAAAPTGGHLFDSYGQVFDFNNPMWAGKYSDPAKTHWLQAYGDVYKLGRGYGLSQAQQQGYFDKFQGFNDPSDWARLQSKFGVDQNQGGFWGSSPADFLGKNIAEWNAQDEAHTQGQWLELAKIAAAALGGMYGASGIGEGTSATAAPTASAAGGTAATQVGMVGASEAAGTGATTGTSGVGTSGSAGGMDWGNTYAQAGNTTTDVPLTGGGEYTGGLNPNVSGSPGLNPGITGSPGLTSYGVEGTSLAPGYFPAESIAGPLTYGSSSLSPSLTQAGTQTPPSPTPTTDWTKFLSNPQLIGGLAGAGLAAMSANGSGSKGTIQTEEGIPDWLMPYAKPALDKYSTDLQNYNVDPYGIMPSAMDQFRKTINGMFLTPNSNPYLEDYFRLGAERIKGSLSPSFGHMQAFGQHSGYNEALSRGLGDYAVGLYGGAYEKERDRQNQAMTVAPNFLGTASAANFSPYQNYLNSISQLGKSKEQPYFSNPFASILGGAMVGSQMGKAFA